MKILQIDQRSPEWHAARLGKLTGSRACDMCATIKSGEAAARRHLRTQLVLERLTGKSQEPTYQSAAMVQGIEREVDAQALYEAVTGRFLVSTGFVAHDTLAAGCSLDGHVGDFDGIIEIKSPLAATHLEYLRTGIVPNDYLKQILHGLWITGAQWCDWVSYNPDFPEALQVRLVRITRDDTLIADYEQKAVAFLEDVEREYQDVLRLAELAVA
jgi:hypothetical protein